MVTRRDYLSALTVGSISITAGCMGGDDSCGPGDTTISSIKDNRVRLQMKKISQFLVKL